MAGNFKSAIPRTETTVDVIFRPSESSLRANQVRPSVNGRPPTPQNPSRRNRPVIFFRRQVKPTPSPRSRFKKPPDQRHSRHFERMCFKVVRVSAPPGLGRLGSKMYSEFKKNPPPPFTMNFSEDRPNEGSPTHKFSKTSSSFSLISRGRDSWTVQANEPAEIPATLIENKSSVSRSIATNSRTCKTGRAHTAPAFKD